MTENGSFLVIAWLVIRFAVPVVITFAVGAWLRRLDMQWRQTGLRFRTPVMIAVPPKCYEAMDCSPAQRAACPAYARSDQPCWEAFTVQGHLQEACLNCGLRRQVLAFRAATAVAAPRA